MISFRAPHDVVLVDYEERLPAAREVLVRTLYSGISAGTELTAYRGTNPYVTKHWDNERRLFVEGTPTYSYPLDAWGYEQVGAVAAVGEGTTTVRRGDIVWGIWGHRSSAIVAEEHVAQHVLPEGVPPMCGIFARIGAVALNAVLDADIHVGEIVAVFGQGVPGLIATQLARLNGGDVIAVDRVSRRLELAASFGARPIDASVAGAAQAIKETTGGGGAAGTIGLTRSA